MALQRAAELVASGDPALNQYGPDEGLPELRQVLREKLERENGLTGVSGPLLLTADHYRDSGAQPAACGAAACHDVMACAVALFAPSAVCTSSTPTAPLHTAQYDVMVTTGANQAFSNVVLALLDPSDRVALYK